MREAYLHLVKKGLLIYRVNRDDPANSGVIKKCKAQRKAFEEHGIKTDMLWLCKEGVLKNETLILKKNIAPHSLKSYQFYFFEFGKILFTEVQKEDYDFIYLRHPFFDPFLVQALRKLKTNSPSIKIFLEINTYPYDSEPKRWMHKLSLKLDQYYRKSAHQYINWIVDYGQRETIWDIPTISIRNGIDVDAIVKSKGEQRPDLLRLIAVGNWSYWHGLDRLLKGIKNYVNAGGQDVSLKVVGEGSAFEETRSFIEKHQLSKYIQLFSPRSGSALDELFDDTDIGIGTMGIHRKKVTLNSSLKHRSYCARGIPFIFSGVDPDFPESLNFVKCFEATEEEISIPEIKLFYENLIKSKPDYQKEMRAYAEAQLTWKRKLADVVKVI